VKCVCCVLWSVVLLVCLFEAMLRRLERDGDRSAAKNRRGSGDSGWLIVGGWLTWHGGQRANALVVVLMVVVCVGSVVGLVQLKRIARAMCLLVSLWLFSGLSDGCEDVGCAVRRALVRWCGCVVADWS
jgi:hypothetical protein